MAKQKWISRALGIAAPLLALLATRAGAQTPVGSLNLMEAGAPGTPSVKKNTFFAYTFFGRDTDTYNLNGTETQLFDTTVGYLQLQLRSMISCEIYLEEFSNNTRTWNTSGQAVNTIGNKHDTYQVANIGRVAGDLLFDAPIAVTKTVLIIS